MVGGCLVGRLADWLRGGRVNGCFGGARDPVSCGALRRDASCCGALRCAVLCCVALRCGGVWCSVLHCVVPWWVLVCCVAWCCGVLWCAGLCEVALRCALICATWKLKATTRLGCACLLLLCSACRARRSHRAPARAEDNTLCALPRWRSARGVCRAWRVAAHENKVAIVRLGLDSRGSFNLMQRAAAHI